MGAKGRYCVLCGKNAVTDIVVRDFKLPTEMGTVTIEGKSTFEKCRSCGETLVPGSSIDHWNRLILKRLASKQGYLTPEELQFIFSILPYTQAEIAKATGRERSTLTKYKKGTNPIDPLFDEALRRIVADHVRGSRETMEILRRRTTSLPGDERVRRIKVGY